MRYFSHIARISEGCIIAAIVFVAFCAATPAQQTSRSYALPHGDYEVEQFAVSSSGDAIIFTSMPGKDDDKRGAYVFNLRSGLVKKVLAAPNIGVFSVPGPHPFAVLADTTLYFVQDDGSFTGPIEIPNIGESLGWTHDGSSFVFTMDRPKVNKDSDAYNETGFTALGILDVATQRVRPISVKLPAYHFYVLQSKDQIFVMDNSMDIDKPLIVNVYDLKGKHLETRMDLYGIIFSPAGRYYLPFIFEAGLAFRVRDANTNRAVLSYQNDGTEEVAEPRWDPKDDTLLLVRHMETDDKGNTISQRLDVLGVPSGKIAKSLPYGIAQWAPDGKSVVVYREGRFVFEEIAP
jgi:hypothetical protein